MTLRISLAQIPSSTDPAANLATVEKQVTAATDAGSRLVVFPEAAMQRFGGPVAHVAQPLDGPGPTPSASAPPEQGSQSSPECSHPPTTAGSRAC